MSAYFLTLLLLFTSLGDASYPSKREKEEFQSCVEACSAQYGNCLRQVDGLWKNFVKNKHKILPIVNACCMKNAGKDAASPEDSFAACTRIRCGAVLFGCQIVKKHEGHMSEDEKKSIRKHQGSSIVAH
ncbi:unnamed protein product [Taenia asiatica]|uniref:Saposin B-type domain-containing protein n=1 Tax=Taenia asiatica TaxID=60517 RepID=A0A0R3VW65_TAEAS|nr:unnamed protein product [Taenia asiatica]